MKAKLEAMLAKKQERKSELLERSKASEDIQELKGINAELDSINGEISELRSMLNSMNENEDDHQVSEPEQRNFNPIATYSMGNTPPKRSEDEDVFATLEYRKAFKDYVMNGKPIPSEMRSQANLRANEMTVVGDIGAVIPTTIWNQVIEDLSVEGKIISRITQTSIQGGIDVPLSDINPVATWLADENTVSDEQKAEMKAKISFSYHVLEAKVAISLLSATISLPVFEATVVRQLKKAVIRAIETAIMAGTGVGQPLGITKYNQLPAEQQIEMTPDNISTVTQWAGVEAKIPEAYEDSVIYVMSKATWEAHLNGMVDAVGQKIGLGKINEKGQKILNGREVLTVDLLPSFDQAQQGDIFALVVDLSKYMLNSNLAMYYKKYFDEDKNKWIHKVLTIADGKMMIGEVNGKLVGAKGLLYIKKGA